MIGKAVLSALVSLLLACITNSIPIIITNTVIFHDTTANHISGISVHGHRLQAQSHLSWLIHSKSVSLDTPCAASSVATSLACTSTTMRALRVLRSSLLSFPLTLFTTCLHTAQCCQNNPGLAVSSTMVLVDCKLWGPRHSL